MNYEATRAEAQKASNEDGFDRGLVRSANGWTSQRLPRRENRYGRDLECEVVWCFDLRKCQPGHGPLGERNIVRELVTCDEATDVKFGGAT